MDLTIALILLQDGILNGAIYALDDWRRVPPEKVAENALKVADFTGLGFEMLKPPSEAIRWR